MFTHDSRYAVLAVMLTQRAEMAHQFQAARRAVRLLKGIVDLQIKKLSFLAALALRATAPVIEPATRYRKYFGHRRNAEQFYVSGNEAVLIRYGFKAMPSDFFRMSRS